MENLTQVPDGSLLPDQGQESGMKQHEDFDPRAEVSKLASHVWDVIPEVTDVNILQPIPGEVGLYWGRFSHGGNIQWTDIFLRGPDGASCVRLDGELNASVMPLQGRVRWTAEEAAHGCEIALAILTKISARTRHAPSDENVLNAVPPQGYLEPQATHKNLSVFERWRDRIRNILSR